MTEDLLSVHAREIGDKAAIIDDRPGEPVVTLTYAELEAYANRVAHAMLSVGVEPGDKVMFCGQNSARLLAFTHSARKVGATAVPLNYRLTDEEAAYVVDNSDAVLAWVDAGEAALFSRIRAAAPREVVIFDGDPLDGQTGLDALLEGAQDGPPDLDTDPGGSMIYTSGTTGKPKGAVRRITGSPEQSAGLLQLIGYQPDDVYLTTGPLYHSGPLGFAGIAAVLGNTVVIQHRFDAEDWLRLLDTHRVTTTFSAPTPIRRICTLDDDVLARYDRSSMARMVANAAPWSMALKELYLDRFPEDSLWEVYGSTEMGVNTVLGPADQRRKPGSCGRAAPFVEIALVGDDGEHITEPHTPGELFVRASSVFDTYYKADEKYASEHKGDFHTVGDIAFVDEEGFYFICDRKKDMIISGGMNVYPAEIEAALEHHPEVYEVAVFGIPSEEWGESVHAVVVRSPGTELDADGLAAYAREHLAGYKVPRSIDFVDELPKTGSGKLLKRELRRPFWEGHGSGVV